MRNIHSNRSCNLSVGVALSGVALSLLMAGSAHAAPAGTDATASANRPSDSTSSDSDKTEIVVTGTFIRGVVPVGSNSITLSAAKIQETAVQSSNELLASIPQVTNYFNRVPVADLGIAVNQIQISRPNIRNLSGNNSASSATLILVDGHRIATAGVNQASVDPDLIPTGAIERVEVQTEGGSATYGADAVAGVINFITHKKFDGVKVDGHYGFAKNYWQYDGSITAGKTWDNGSAWVSYSYTKSDALYGRERSYIRNLDYSKQPYVGIDLGCEKSNLTLGTTINGDTTVRNITTYAAPAFVAGTSNRCENVLNSTIVPRAQRHGVVGGLDWDFGGGTSIDVRAYWGQRKTHASSDFSGSVPVGPLNPAAASLPTGLVVGPTTFCFSPSLCFPATTAASVSFNLRPLLGDSAARSDTMIREYGANAELKHTFGDNWQLRGLANWSESDSTYDLTRLNQGRLNT
ncbi:MAG: TonB-dependent receptor plug domain-containing protein, partial [Novosphingobium sp.]